MKDYFMDLVTTAQGYEREIVIRLIQYAEYLPPKTVAELIFKACKEIRVPDITDKLTRIAAKCYLEG